MAEDGTFADSNDEPFVVQEDSRVGLLHPLSASTEKLGAFAELFADYIILQPFPQLTRSTFVLDPSELRDGGTGLARWEGTNIATGRVYGLKARGWSLSYAAATKRLGHAVATLEFSPGIEGTPGGSVPEQTLGVLELAGTTFEELDAIVLSELIRDVDRAIRSSSD